MAKLESGKKTFMRFGQMFKHFRPYLKPYRMLISGGFLALLGEIVMRILEPWPLKFVIDYILMKPKNGSVADQPHFFDAWDPTMILWGSAIAVVLIAALRAMATYASTVSFALAGNRVITKVRKDLYSHIQCLPLSFHTKSRQGDLIVRVIGDVGLLQEVTVTAAMPLVANIFVLIGMFGVMVWLNWQLACVAMAVIPLFWLTTVRLSRRIREVSRKQRRSESAMAATAAESISAIKTVQALSLEDTFSEQFSKSSQKSLKDGVKAKRLSAGLERTVDILVALATAVVLLVGARRVMTHELTPGDLIVFLAYLKNAFRPLQKFAKYIGRLSKASAAGERIVELMSMTPEARDLPDAIVAPRFEGRVQFKDVSFFYEPNKIILNRMNFTVEPGECVAIIAPSGAGKSTLLSLLLRLYESKEGEIRIDDHDIRRFTVASYRSQISIVLQDTLLFAANVYDNIAYGGNAATEDEIEQAARMANAHDFISNLPEGYHTILGERGATLSNGQRQRISIARAAIRKSPVLILDEPTTGLDKENERDVMAGLEQLSQGCTTFLVTHDLNVAMHSDRILFIENGRISETGTHHELLQVNGAYANLFHIKHASDSRDGLVKESHGH